MHFLKEIQYLVCSIPGRCYPSSVRSHFIQWPSQGVFWALLRPNSLEDLHSRHNSFCMTSGKRIIQLDLRDSCQQDSLFLEGEQTLSHFYMRRFQVRGNHRSLISRASSLDTLFSTTGPTVSNIWLTFRFGGNINPEVRFTTYDIQAIQDYIIKWDPLTPFSDPKVSVPVIYGDGGKLKLKTP